MASCFHFHLAVSSVGVSVDLQIQIGNKRRRYSTVENNISIMNNAFKNVGTTVTSALHLPSSKDNQHPPASSAEGKKSHRISVDVEASYKVFTQFQGNLKHIATLYKTEHELMKSLNENGLYTAKCYQKMLSASPLQHIVSSTIEVEGTAPDAKIHGDLKTYDEKAKSGEPSATKEIKSVNDDDDDDDDVGYVSFPKMEPEEVLEEQEYNFDKQGTQSSFIASSNNLVLEQEAKGQDPPSKDSLLKKDQEIAVVEDETASKTLSAKEVKVVEEHVSSELPSGRPSEADYPVDEMPDDEANFNDITINSDEGVNVMVGVIDDDDDDSFHDVIDDDDDSFAHDTNPNVGETISDSSAKDDKETKKLNKGPVDPDGDVVEHEKDISSDVELNRRDLDNEPELNNSVENVEKVEPSAPEIDEKETLTSFDQLREATYFDVHKLIYKETNSYIAKHSKLVEYAEDWEKTVTKRVQSMYVEYQKLRKGLNHYIGKVNTLESERRRTKERNKDFPQKKVEKLLRNETKLLGTRRSHDVAGIDLIIFIDEVVTRSYKDAYPLLQKSVAFEMDFSSLQAKMYGDLSAAATLLDQVSRKESLSSSHRLLQLKDSLPEEINFHRFKGDWD